jgi:hypothetical protein
MPSIARNSSGNMGRNAASDSAGGTTEEVAETIRRIPKKHTSGAEALRQLQDLMAPFGSAQGRLEFVPFPNRARTWVCGTFRPPNTSKPLMRALLVTLVTRGIFEVEL